ncbi:Crp/Fnr family transcriptional regulator [Paraburkholderia antibiotica]|uniref:Crp/Fnr family transcriptional regulator n=1 Tax=Paraburkholderia antibiotica TaxID=2728839 RepID=A0A7Y0FGY0_9BURK|nr:Crp/Fnr family transcriptional regulator [Paraburkholderia antibiotica]NML35495.1 Crp/Fnr family transcriptional regulator [Paraburkholderia antibiotica]
MKQALALHFDATLAQALADAAHPFGAPAGMRLFATGALCRQFLLLTEGTVRVQSMSEAGREIVLYRVNPGESCVMTSACLLGARTYLAEGVAETALRGALLPAPAFERLLGESTAFRSFVFGAFVQRLAGLVEKVGEVALERIDARLARFLLRHDGAIVCTHYAIAIELGTAREVVSRQLRGFEQRGWLTLRRGRIELLDRAALQALHDESVT